MKGLEEPMTQGEIDKVLEEKYGGSIGADEFAFEVFDKSNKRIFATKFDASVKIPHLNNDQTSWTTFSWAFDLPDYLSISNEL